MLESCVRGENQVAYPESNFQVRFTLNNEEIRHDREYSSVDSTAGSPPRCSDGGASGWCPPATCRSDRSEVGSFLAEYRQERDEIGRQRLVRNGYLPEREIQTGLGGVPVRLPRVRDRVATKGDCTQSHGPAVPNVQPVGATTQASTSVSVLPVSSASMSSLSASVPPSMEVGIPKSRGSRHRQATPPTGFQSNLTTRSDPIRPLIPIMPNKWPLSIGFTGHFPSESVVRFRRSRHCPWFWFFISFIRSLPVVGAVGGELEQFGELATSTEVVANAVVSRLGFA